MNDPRIERLICAVLRGEEPAWPCKHDAVSVEAFLAASEYHGVQSLLHACLQESNGADWPPAIRRELQEQAIGWAIWELRHKQVVEQVLAALAAIPIQPVLFKGTALSYSIYQQPSLRTRADTDLIIPRGSRDIVENTLVAMGFERAVAVTGEFVRYQDTYAQVHEGGNTHAIDLHWRISNSELLARLFTYEELFADAAESPALGPHARIASPAHALLLACMYRAVHKQAPYYVHGVAHFGGDRLAWLYDIHLLSATFTPVHWDEFLRLAKAKGLCAVCLEGMARTRDCFQTPFPASMLAALARTGAGEPVAIYLEAGRFRQPWMDFRAIEGSAAKLRFLRESIIPSAAYMRHKYPRARPGWLPWLYARRAFGGIFKRLVQGGRPGH